MLSTSDVFVFLITVTFYSKYAFSLENYDAVYKKKIVVEHSNSNLNDKVVNVKEVNIEQPKNTHNLESELKNVFSNYALEGGGDLQQTSTTFRNNHQVEPEIVGEETHSKGSKGRKGVGYPGSSIVPRKGVDVLSLSDSLPSSLPLQETVKVSSTISSNKTTTTVNVTEFKTNLTNPTAYPLEKVTEKITLAKKPEVVSDIGDSVDFDSYTIIKTSTTGEDYVIVGIIIVIGIWFSVFGALIFYRRAGEYWDRRHYRRMDFLVEGMYND